MYILYFSIQVKFSLQMDFKAQLEAKCALVRKWYKGALDCDKTFEVNLTESEIKLFLRMQRFHKLSHTRYESRLFYDFPSI